MTIYSLKHTYIWMVDGVVKDQIANPTSSGVNVTFTFDNPGYKNIACQAVYKHKTQDVYFAESKEINKLVYVE